MNKHPNEFSRRQIIKYFKGKFIDVEVTSVENGYVIFFHKFSTTEACTVEDPAGRILWDEKLQNWKLYWISANFRWILYHHYENLSNALDAMFGENGANYFHKVL